MASYIGGTAEEITYRAVLERAQAMRAEELLQERRDAADNADKELREVTHRHYAALVATFGRTILDLVQRDPGSEGPRASQQFIFKDPTTRAFSRHASFGGYYSYIMVGGYRFTLMACDAAWVLGEHGDYDRHGEAGPVFGMNEPHAGHPERQAESLAELVLMIDRVIRDIAAENEDSAAECEWCGLAIPTPEDGVDAAEGCALVCSEACKQALETWRIEDVLEQA